MKRGDLVIVSVAGAYGKPRPSVIVQSDFHTESDSVLICQLTSDLQPAPFYRLTIVPTAANGLRKDSQVMVDKVQAVQRTKCSAVIGRLTNDEMEELDALLIYVLGLSDIDSVP